MKRGGRDEAGKEGRMDEMEKERVKARRRGKEEQMKNKEKEVKERRKCER